MIIRLALRKIALWVGAGEAAVGVAIRFIGVGIMNASLRRSGQPMTRTGVAAIYAAAISARSQLGGVNSRTRDVRSRHRRNASPSRVRPIPLIGSNPSVAVMISVRSVIVL